MSACEQPVGVRRGRHEGLPQVGLEVLALHEDALGRAVGLIPVHERDVRRLEPFGEHVELGLLLQAPRIVVQGFRRRAAAPNPRPPTSTATAAADPGRADSWRARYPYAEAQDDEGTFDGLVPDLGVSFEVVDDAQPVPQRIDELAVHVAAPALGCARRRLHRCDEQLQTLAPSVRAEVVEIGAFTRRSRQARESREWSTNLGCRHGRRHYTTIENKC